MKNEISLMTTICKAQHCRIDLKKKFIKIKETVFFEDGENKNNLENLIQEDDLKQYGIEDAVSQPWEVISALYQVYKHSRPSKVYRPLFKAISKDEMSDEDMVYGEDRRKALEILNGYIILALSMGILNWQDESHWFWQDENDKDLVILKEWL